MQFTTSAGMNTTVRLDLSHSHLNIRVPEVPFDMHDKVGHIKEFCQKRFGTAIDNMRLVLQDSHGNAIASLNEDGKTLGFYSPQDHYCIHVVDLDPNSAAKARDLEDVSQIEKYEMSEEDYDKLPSTLRE